MYRSILPVSRRRNRSDQHRSRLLSARDSASIFSIPRAYLVSLVALLFLVLFVLWNGWNAAETPRTQEKPWKQPSENIEMSPDAIPSRNFAVNAISSMASTTSVLKLMQITFFNEKSESSRGLLLNTDRNMKMIMREESSGRFFEHVVRVSVDSSGAMALTKYTCGYDRSEKLRRYEKAVLPGSLIPIARVNTKPTLRTLSFNLWNYNHWIKRMPLVQEMVEKLMPDVIAFQEVRAKKSSPEKAHRYQVEDLSRLLPDYQFVFEPAMTFADSGDIVHEGVAIFSRYPILHTEVLMLTRDPDDSADFHQRICVLALVDSPIGLVNVFNTHMSLSGPSRARTLPEIARFAQAQTQTDKMVLMGDFNQEALPGINSMQPYGWKDAWLDIHSDQRLEKGYTFNTWFHRSRIDYVYVKGVNVKFMSNEGREGVDSPGLEPGFGVDNPQDTLYASDHMLPFAVLEAA